MLCKKRDHVILSLRKTHLHISSTMPQPTATDYILILNFDHGLTVRLYEHSIVSMSGALSGHLLESYMLAQTPRGPFGQSTPQIATSGAMAFAPSMHGTFSQLPSMLDHGALMGLSEETAHKIDEMQAKLNKKLGPEYISQRPGPTGGPKLTYAEGWKIINLANEVFGFNGWSSSVVNMTTDFIDYSEESRRYNVGVTAIVRVTLRDGVYHEDVGYGMLENSKSKGAALDKVLDSKITFTISNADRMIQCKKEAVTDGVKRALRNFGNLLGNCLYDKSYTQEIVKIKVPPVCVDAFSFISIYFFEFLVAKVQPRRATP